MEKRSGKLQHILCCLFAIRTEIWKQSEKVYLRLTKSSVEVPPGQTMDEGYSRYLENVGVRMERDLKYIWNL